MGADVSTYAIADEGKADRFDCGNGRIFFTSSRVDDR